MTRCFPFASFCVLWLLIIGCPLMGYGQTELVHQWSVGMGGQESDRSNAMFRSKSGALYITGYFRDTVDMDPGPATDQFISEGGKDIFLSKFNALGHYQWTITMGGSGDDEAMDLILDGQGHIFVTGYFSNECDFNPAGTQAEFLSEGSGDAFLAKYDTTGAYQWALPIGSNDWQSGVAVHLDGAGDPIIGGDLEGTVDFDPDPVDQHDLASNTPWHTDIFIAKYHRDSRDMLWAYSINGKSKGYSDHLYDMTLDAAGNIYVTGEVNDTVDLDVGSGTQYEASERGTGTNNNILLAKYDSNMDLQWGHVMGDNSDDDEGHALAVNDAGEVYLSGFFQQVFDPDPGPDSAKLASNGGKDLFLAQYDPSGQYQWAFNIGTNYDDAGWAMDLDGQGNIFLTGQTGQWSNTIDFDPDPVYTANYETQGGGDVFIAQYDPTGDYLTAVGMGSNQWDGGNDLVVDSTGSVWFTGFFQSTIDMDPGQDTSELVTHGTYDAFLGQYCAPPAISVDTTAFPNEVCVYDAPFALSGGDPSGGVFSGPGVSGNTFYPANAGPGSHTITYTYVNQNGCSNFAEQTIRVDPKPSTPSIEREGTDSIRSTLSAAHYEWFQNGSPFGSDTQQVQVTQAGDYQLVIRKKGCASDTSDSFCFIPLEITGLQNSTCGNADGEATVEVTGGDPADYTYQWSSGSDSATATNLASGYYSVRVKDTVRGCENLIPVTISDLAGPSISTSVTPVTCYGGQDGAISIGVSGTAPPHRLQWSTGDTTEQLEELSAGSYQVVVTDANGCQTTKSIKVTEPEELKMSVTTSPAGCGNSNGSATVSFEGGVSPYQIDWVNLGTSSDPPTMTNLSAGFYQVILRDGNNCSLTKNVTINETNGATIVVDSISAAACDGQGGGIHITTSGGLSPYTYEWSHNNDPNEDLTNAPAGDHYVKVTSANGCVTLLDTSIHVQPPPQQEICLITVDSAIHKNTVVWEKTNDPRIDHFNIYREGSQSNSYFRVGSVETGSLSMFTDSLADPAVRSWRYKITTVDTCGNESALSNHHESIHLSMNTGLNNTVNLDWNDYEGFNYPGFNIYRYDNLNGWQLLDQVSKNVNTYTDTMPSQSGFLNYMVEAVPPFACTATKAKNFNSTRSNRASTSGPTPSGVIGVQGKGMWLQVFPNPTRGKLQFRFQQPEKGGVHWRVFDGSGRRLHAGKVDDREQVERTIDLSGYRNGIYQIQVISDEGNVLSKRIVVQK